MNATRLLTSHRLSAAICLLLFMSALIPRLLSYNFGLPYIDHPDEPASYLKAQEWQGLFDLEGYHDGYPPAFLAINLMVQLGVGANGPSGLAPTVQILRFLAVFASAAVSVFLFLAAQCIAQPLGKTNALAAGLVAGSIWALSPIAVEYVYATPDPYVFLFSAITLYAALNSVRAKHHGRWALGSIVTGLIAAFFKYSALPVIMPGFIALAYLWINKPEKRVTFSRAFVMGIMLIAISALFLVGIYGAGSLNTPGTSDVARLSGFASLLNLQYFIGNFSTALQMIGLPGAVMILLSPALLIATRYGVKSSDSAAQLKDSACQLILCYWLLITVPLLINTFNSGTVNGLRFLIPATLAAIVLVAATIPAIGVLLFSRYSFLSPALTILVGFLLIVPPLPQTIAIIHNRQLPDSRVALRQWVDRNLLPGSILVTADNHKTFNPIWGGIPYQHWFDWVERANLTVFSPQEWHQETGVGYIAYPVDQWETAITLLDLDDVLYLGEFGGYGWRGPYTILARIEPLQHLSELSFAGEIALQGFEFTHTPMNAGDILSLQLFWEALDHPPANYSTFLHLTSAGSVVPLAQADGAPGGSDQQTALWQVGEYFFSDPLELTLPLDLESGNYVIRIGLYDYLTGARLPVSNPENTGDSAILFRFTVDDSGAITNLNTVDQTG